MIKYILVLCVAAIIGMSNSSKIDYNVNSCILATIDAEATIEILGKTIESNNINGTRGKCDAVKPTLEIPFEQNITLLMNFNLKNGTAYLSTLSLRFSDGYNDHTSYLNLEKMLSGENQFYACDNPETYTLKSDEGNVSTSITINSIKIQAFGIKDDKYSDDKLSCAEPKINDTTPAVSPTPALPTTGTPTTGAPTKGTPTTGALTTSTPTTRAPTAKPATYAAPINASVADSNGNVCLLIEFTGTLAVKFVNTLGKNDTYTYSIAQKKKVTGNCGNDTETVHVTLMNDWILSFNFSMNQKKKSSRRLLADGAYEMNEVELRYNEASIPKAKPPHTPKVAFSIMEGRNTANVGQSYRCRALENVVMDNVTLSTTNFQAEAFRTSKTVDFDANPQICKADMTDPGNLVPIIVGVVLALLVLVIIIAYLIGRRRNQSGYQSV